MAKLRFSFRRKSPKRNNGEPAAAAAARARAPSPDFGGGVEVTAKKLFNKNKKGPGGIEVTTTYATPSGPQDEVSVITPVTGLPPDSPNRLRELPSLLPPQMPQTTSRPMDAANLYSAGNYSPPSTPTKEGGMNIDVPSGGLSESTDDDISVMTPFTGMVMSSPEKINLTKKHPQRLAPPQILEDDDDERSRELTVYEDEGVDGSGDTPIRLSPNRSKSPLNTINLSTITSAKTLSSRKNRSNFLTSLIKSKRSWLTNTEYFQKAIDSAFDMVDVDKSGDVTMEELYAGLLLIHLKMAVYVGAPACRPASKSYVEEIFHLLDKDDDGTLSKEEFATVMKILYSQVFTRIVIQWGLTLMIVPVISQYIIKYTKLLFWIAHEFWKDIDDDLDPLQRLLWKLWTLFLYITPQSMDRVMGAIWMAFSKVPKGLWTSMPFTMLTLAQTSIVLPYALNRVEDFFRRVAHSDVVAKKEEESRSSKLKEC